MLDRNYILENQDEVRENIKNRGEKLDFDRFLALDAQRVELLGEVEALRKERNENAQAIKSATPESRQEFIDAGKVIKEKLGSVEPQLQEVEAEYYELYAKIPNKTHADAPVGADEDGNVVVRTYKEKPQFDFEPKEHWELGADLDIIDLETAARVSGARFAYIKGDLVLLEFAIIQYVMSVVTNLATLQTIAQSNRIDVDVTTFEPIIPPVMVRPEVMHQMGRLEPRDERYHIPSDDLYLVGSAEHTLGPMHMGQTFEEAELPKRYIGFSTAFRREAGSYGKDTKGIFRVHQFDKLEIETYSVPEKSLAEQDFIIAIQEHLMQGLDLPYQVVMKCTGDMGDPDYREYDIETWLPGQGRYRETHTSDLMTDYQSRRLGIKVKREETGKAEFVHMNDATVFAIGRILIAIIENYQDADGTIRIPEALQQYVGKDRIVARNK
jgi:seryl-tRNA synthetase